MERWWPETHSFQLPHGEITIMLQDMEVIIGAPIEDLSMVGKTKLEWGNLCEKHGCAVCDKVKTMLA